MECSVFRVQGEGFDTDYVLASMSLSPNPHCNSPNMISTLSTEHYSDNHGKTVEDDHDKNRTQRALPLRQRQKIQEVLPGARGGARGESPFRLSEAISLTPGKENTPESAAIRFSMAD